MRSIAFVIMLLASSCKDRELDLAHQIVLAEEAEVAARRELLRLERELASSKLKSLHLENQLAAQRQVVRAAEVAARKLRILSKQ